MFKYWKLCVRLYIRILLLIEVQPQTYIFSVTNYAQSPIGLEPKLGSKVKPNSGLLLLIVERCVLLSKRLTYFFTIANLLMGNRKELESVSGVRMRIAISDNTAKPH